MNRIYVSVRMPALYSLSVVAGLLCAIGVYYTANIYLAIASILLVTQGLRALTHEMG